MFLYLDQNNGNGLWAILTGIKDRMWTDAGTVICRYGSNLMASVYSVKY